MDAALDGGGRYAGDEVVCAVRDAGSMPAVACEPVRRFSWCHGQRHRSGLAEMCAKVLAGRDS